MTRPTAVQPPRDSWRVEMVSQETVSGIVLFEYAIREPGKEPFLLNNHRAQMRETHQRIRTQPDGALMHVSGVNVPSTQVEEFLATDPRAYRWADKDLVGNWRDDRGRVLAPFVFPTAPWAGGHDEELDPQWLRETHVVPLAQQVAAALARYQDRAESRKWMGDRRGTTLNLQVGANADDRIFTAAVPNNMRNSGTVATDTTFISFGTSDIGSGARRAAVGRFTGVNIAQGSTINSATASVWGQNGETTAVESVIEAYDDDNPSTVVTAWDGTQAFTTASVTWDFSTTFTNDVEFPTPDISSVMQELVNRAGWPGNGACVICILDDLNTDSNRRRSVDDYSTSSAQAMALDIDYTAAGGGDPEGPLVGGKLVGRGILGGRLAG